MVSQTKPDEPQKPMSLDGLFTHLCSSTGLYSKETFLSLYGCITRMIRDNRLTGFAMTRTLNDESFETVAHALSSSGLPVFRLDTPEALASAPGMDAQTGFLLVLTDRLCATLFWSVATHDTFRMYDGGWTFHPGDSRTMAAQLIGHLHHPELERLLAETLVDRRYDDKLNLLVTALVHGLENRNRELTVALSQLQAANKRNVDTERLAAIGQLSSVIAHEIRNPLGLIDLYAKLVEDQFGKLDLPDVPDEQKTVLLKNLSMIRQATGSLETILSELTNYSRPLQLNTQLTDIYQLVADVCEFYQPSYQDKGVGLVLSAPLPETYMLSLDGDKIRQALINLLKNALEASSQSGTVTVTLATRGQRDPHLYIRVTDEGRGVNAQHIQKLFTPYFSTKGNGTGLGLAHSRKILQAHGGNVELLSSVPDQGSTFALILPKSVGADAGRVWS